MTHWLLKHEGFFVGGSAGLNVCGAVMAARQLGPGHVIVTVLCDDATRYLDKYWTDDGLKAYVVLSMLLISSLIFHSFLSFFLLPSRLGLSPDTLGDDLSFL